MSAATRRLACGLALGALVAVSAMGPMSRASAVGAPAAPTVDVGPGPGLQLENSFVSAKGWVKPEETYPSRIIVTNPAAAPSGPATVTVDAPLGTTFTDASGAGSPAVTPTQIT